MGWGGENETRRTGEASTSILKWKNGGVGDGQLPGAPVTSATTEPRRGNGKKTFREEVGKAGKVLNKNRAARGKGRLKKKYWRQVGNVKEEGIKTCWAWLLYLKRCGGGKNDQQVPASGTQKKKVGGWTKMGRKGGKGRGVEKVGVGAREKQKHF